MRIFKWHCALYYFVGNPTRLRFKKLCIFSGVKISETKQRRVACFKHLSFIKALILSEQLVALVFRFGYTGRAVVWLIIRRTVSKGIKD